MKKILFSLKTDFNGRSDVVGLPLLMILYADFYSYLFKYQVEVFDPFFEIEKNIKNYKFKIIRDLDTNFNKQSRISNPLFYVSWLKTLDSNKIIKIEGKKNIKTNIHRKKKDIRLIQRMDLNNLEYLNKFNVHKTFDIPYQFYLEWLFRDKFLSKIDLKKKIKLPLAKKNTFALQFDYFYNKDSNLPFEIISKIRKENKSANIITYGLDRKDCNNDILKSLKSENCLILDDYSSNPLVKGILLGNCSNYYISKSNGFTDFAMTVGKFKKKIKKSFCIDDASSAQNITERVRRNLREGLLENRISNNSFFYNKMFEYHNSQSILKKSGIFGNIKPALLEMKKSFFIGYSLNSIKTKFFSHFFDELINNDLLNDFSNNLKDTKLILFKKNKFFNFNNNVEIPRKKINLKYAVHILTHYKLVNENDNSMFLDGSLDFNKPDFLKNITKQNLVNPGNLFYEDLFSYFIRKCSTKTFKNINSKKKIKKILVLTNPDLKIKKNSKYFNIILNKFMKKEAKMDSYDWNKISNKIKKSYKCKLNFLYIKKNFLNINYGKKKIRILLTKKNLTNIINQYENIICFPTELSLMVKYLSTDKNNLILLSKYNIKKDLIDYNKKLFNTEFKFKYSDIFDTKFQDLTELFLYLFKSYKKI